jgi:hypothetical protein
MDRETFKTSCDVQTLPLPFAKHENGQIEEEEIRGACRINAHQILVGKHVKGLPRTRRRYDEIKLGTT